MCQTFERRGERKGKSEQVLKEITTENFLKMTVNISLQFQKAEPSLNRKNLRKHNAKYMLVKLLKVKEKILLRSKREMKPQL